MFIIPTLHSNALVGFHRGILRGAGTRQNAITKQEEDMDTIIQSRFIHNVEVIEALTHMRQEWEQAADGDSLLKVKGSVGLLLADFANVLRLTHEEQSMVLGETMISQLQDILVTTTTDKMEM